MKGLYSRFKSSHIAITAVFFVLALTGAILWKVFAPDLQRSSVGAVANQAMLDAEATTSSGILKDSEFDPVSEASASALIELQGAYMGLQAAGTYSTSTASDAAAKIGLNLHAPLVFKGYVSSDLTTDTDTSNKRALAYRKDLQASMKPLLDNKRSELELFGLYSETHDTKYLDQLRAEAKNYRAAASSTARVVVPEDAVAIHLGALNAMTEFASVIESMADHAQDPIGAVLLLQNYNQAESDMYSSFDALASYFKHKTS